MLATQTLFLPQDAGLSEARQSQLVAVLSSAAREGVPLRAAVIASASDLGSVTELWRQPQTYARFLAQELALVYRGPVLVVMPSGFGLFSTAGVPPSVRAAGTTPPPPGSASRLGTATLSAIERIGAASGHPLPVPSATGAPPPTGSSSQTVPWLVFLSGLALTAVAWTLSLRARPLEVLRRRSGPS